jgi:trehalose synthase
MRVTDTSDLWWKTAVFYNLNLETYLDWDDDGVGDLVGLAHRLDYLAELGVTCLWLAPFYPSPREDNGYDIADYFDVDPRYGHLGDLVEVVRTAKDRGMRIIVDLVVNHTSDQHPWFQAARQDRESPYRDFYIWRDEPPEDQRDSMFPDREDGVWFYDEVAGQYYEHSFYRHQPDLNTTNPKVRDEIAKVIGFWLQMGVDGFRVDAVPFLIEAGGGEREHEYLRAIRGYVGRRSGSGVLLGEVNLPYEEQIDFFGDANGDELTMQFDFVANQQLYLALARQDATPLVEALRSRPATAVTNQWGNFVRNHDELTLDQLSEEERQEVFAAYAPEESMQIHGRGIRRRLPPMLGGDPRSIRMVYSLMFSLPGAPVLYYGEEIGMGENLAVPGRGAVRTPMQWTGEPNGGFSHAEADELPLPMVDGGFSPTHVNVSDQENDPGSMLNFVRSLIAAYRKSPEIGWGELEILDPGDRSVLAHSVTAPIGQLVALHNFSREGRTVRVTLPGHGSACRVVDLLGDEPHALDDDGHLEVHLEGYDHRWLRIVRPGEKRLL